MTNGWRMQGWRKVLICLRLCCFWVNVRTNDLQVWAHDTMCVWEKTAKKVGQRLAKVVRRRAAYTGQGAVWGCCRNRQLHQPHQGPMEEYYSARKTCSPPTNPDTRKPLKKNTRWPAMLYLQTTHCWTYMHRLWQSCCIYRDWGLNPIWAMSWSHSPSHWPL